MRNRAMVKLATFAALVAAAITLALPATASAEALVFTQAPCAFFFGGKAYAGSGTNVVTPAGLFVLTCHMSLVSGTPVDRATTTTVGNCEVVETPSGRANASCIFEL
jgi:Na+-translocating ferredoxin:NAD+ oxidoreductase RnfD subunit